METIHLPPSKSILNRFLLLTALSGKLAANLPSDMELPNDVLVMKRLLFENPGGDFNVEDAGTAFRFLTAFLSIKPGRHLLYGTATLNSRPIVPLVDALKSLGASITYTGNGKSAPLEIEGNMLEGGEVTVDASVSSQFVSALMLIAPALTHGLKIHLRNPTSIPYLEITAYSLKMFGVICDLDESLIEVEPCANFTATRAWLQPVESDWSSAAFWYSLAVISRSDFKLNNLSKESIQGDKILMEIFYHLGIATRQNGADLEIIYQSSPDQEIEMDFKSCPDLAPAVIVTCASRNIRARFFGLENLMHKESDRTGVLQRELKKIGRDFNPSKNYWELEKPLPGWEMPQRSILFDPSNDHRLAMAFACLKVINNEINVLNPECVTKSYPGFWNEFYRVFHLKP